MTEPTSSELDPREELASLVASTRALFEQYEASGCDALIADDAAAVAAFLTGAGMPPVASGRGDAGPRPAFRPGPAGAAPPPRSFEPQRAAPPPPPSREPPREPIAAGAPSEEPRTAQPPREPVRETAARPRPLPDASPPQHEPAFRHDAPGPHPDTRPEANHNAPPRAQIGIAQTAGPAQPSGPDADDRRMRLVLVAEAVRGCTKCVLHESRTQTVFARGNPYAELCFIGEGPGENEDAQGEPFVGKAGQLLDKMIAAMGYRRDEVYICNAVKCRPPDNRKPEPAEMDACSPYLRDQLGLVKPKVIVALGATAMTGLTGSTEGITRLRGKWKLYKGTIPLMPTFHPAYLLRDPSKKREVWEDLQEVMKHLGKASAGRAGGPPGADRGDD